MAVFPGALPAAGTANPADTLAAAGHTALHNNADGEIRALATKLGTGASSPASNRVLRGDGAGTSSWAQVELESDVSGVLPLASGGTGASSDSDARTNLDIYSTSEVDSAIDAAKQAMYPVGSIYISTSSSSPDALFGFGTWEAYGAGRVLVGVGTSDQEFTADATGGESNHTLTTSEMPAHTHNWLSGTGFASGGGNIYARNDAGFNISALTDSTGGDDAHNNLQPYVVVYMWRRTA
jgi:hypothetical protein